MYDSLSIKEIEDTMAVRFEAYVVTDTAGDPDIRVGQRVTRNEGDYFIMTAKLDVLRDDARVMPVSE